MPTTRSLPAELTIYTVGEFHPQCLAWLGGGRPSGGADSADNAESADEDLRVGAGAVAEVDAAGVQLLLSLSNALRRQHRRLRLVGPSAALSSACATLGVAALLADAPAPEPAP